MLYRRYYANLCSHAVRYVLAKEVAEDLVTEIFLGLWEKQNFNHITTCYGAYLYRAVRNRAYNYVRHELNQTCPLTPVDDDDFSQPDTPETVLYGHDLIQRLDAEIQALPAQCRRAFILSRHEGKRYAEIAAKLAISPKGVEHLSYPRPEPPAKTPVGRLADYVSLLLDHARATPQTPALRLF